MLRSRSGASLFPVLLFLPEQSDFISLLACSNIPRLISLAPTQTPTGGYLFVLFGHFISTLLNKHDETFQTIIVVPSDPLPHRRDSRQRCASARCFTVVVLMRDESGYMMLPLPLPFHQQQKPPTNTQQKAEMLTRDPPLTASTVPS